MILSARAIANEIKAGRLRIDPFDEEFLKPASYVLRLGSIARKWKRAEGRQPLTIWHLPNIEDVLPPASEMDVFRLLPSEVLLATTHEAVGLPEGLVGRLSTLSHIGRLGVSTFCNATHVSPGFGSQTPTNLALMLVSSNPNEILLRPGLPICHLSLARVDDPKDDTQRPLGKSVYEAAGPIPNPNLEGEFGPLIEDEMRRLSG